ncbi:MAG: glycosyltransferase, partial [Bacilli bacterium]|nr:glycosyltransferase [Bacilli bacterium]
DMLTTVSTTYAREILTDYYGYGMQRLLQDRFTSLVGITNGISYKEFDPQTDKLIETNYSFSNYREGKQQNKLALARKMQVDYPLEKPLIGIVSRLVNQKGFDLVKRVFDEMLESEDFYLVVLGDGETEYVDYFLDLEKRFPEHVRVKIGYDNKLAHLIYAASDMFLMPSKFEPCGLGQLIALRYGSIPIVRETGGLVDTVQPFNEYDQTGNGFSFTHFNAHDMMHVIRYAISTYHVPEAWDLLVKAAMEANYSWRESAKTYKKLYKRLSK